MEASPPAIHVHQLWERLTADLSDILDAHGVCAAVAYDIAILTGVTTVVALSGPLGDYFDIWICESNGELQQMRWEGDQPAFRELIASGEATVQEKLSVPPSQVVKSDLWLLASDKVLFSPLPAEGGGDTGMPEGAICLIDPPPDCMLSAGNIRALAQHVAIFLDRAFMRRDKDRQRIEFDIVYDLTYSLSASLSMENIFRQLSDPVRRTLNVETISVGLTDSVTGEIVFVDMLLGPLFKSLPPIRLQPGQGIAGQVAQTGKPLIVNDVNKDQRFYSKVDQDSGFRTHSILCVPLTVEQRVIGVLEAINKRNGHFNTNDLRLLQAITGPLAAAIENARLHGDVLAAKGRIEAIVANMSEGLLTADPARRITAANESIVAMLGSESAEELLGMPIDDVIRSTSGSDFAAFLEQVWEEVPETLQMASELYRKDGGTVPVLIGGASVGYEDETPAEMILVFSDLRQIREVERMRDDFFHNIVHELRTPLATILMYARLLREGKARSDKAKEDRFLGVIERESDRLQRMVRQMLQLSKLEAHDIERTNETVDLNFLFEELIPPLADRAIDKGLTFKQRIASDLPHVEGSHEMLYSVFKNLIENAVKFTFSGAVTIEAAAAGNVVRVEIEDDGIGIPAAARPNLFKRFYRAQTAVERGIAGTGLGLYMAKEALARHNGDIDYESEQGVGTRFTVRLPALPNDKASLT